MTLPGIDAYPSSGLYPGSLFTQVICTGTITLGTGRPAIDALIEAIPGFPFTNGGKTISDPIVTTTGSDGSFSIVLPANDDALTTPAGSYYLIRVHVAGTGFGSDIYEQWPVTISQAYAPTIDLLSLAPNLRRS